ncbi:MAG TPA: hypothetical protein VKQ32_23655 [Polyangia bacterium]|nr:hypothetical protein [Polyangia bacterium]
MMREQRWVILAGAIATVGCGSSGDGGTPSTCMANMITLAGELDGQPVDVQEQDMGLAFQQLSMPYTLDVTYADGTLHVEWRTLFPNNGAGASATGTVIMPAAAPHAGETICAGSGTIRDTSDNMGHSNYIFTLGTLSSGPTCPGAALAGSIDGCVAD